MSTTTPTDTIAYTRGDEPGTYDVHEGDTLLGSVAKQRKGVWVATTTSGTALDATTTRGDAAAALHAARAEAAAADEQPKPARPRARRKSLATKFTTREVWERLAPVVRDLKREHSLPRNAGVEVLLHERPRTSEQCPTALSHAVTRRGDVVGSITPLEAEQHEQVRPFGAVIDLRLSQPGPVDDRPVVDTVTLWMGDLQHAPVVVCNDPVGDDTVHIGVEHIDEDAA